MPEEKKRRRTSEGVWYSIAIVSTVLVLVAGVCAATIRIHVPPESLNMNSILAISDLHKWLTALVALAIADLVLLAIQGDRSFRRKS